MTYSEFRNQFRSLYDNGELSIIFYEDDSGFDGNDFEYRYSLDAGSTKAFFTDDFSWPVRQEIEYRGMADRQYSL